MENEYYDDDIVPIWEEEDDPSNFARGCIWGLIGGTFMWAAFFYLLIKVF